MAQWGRRRASTAAILPAQTPILGADDNPTRSIEHNLGNKTLSFSRLSRQPLNEQPMGLTDLVHQVLGDLRTTHAGRRVDLMVGDCRSAGPT